MSRRIHEETIEKLGTGYGCNRRNIEEHEMTI